MKKILFRILICLISFLIGATLFLIPIYYEWYGTSTFFKSLILIMQLLISIIIFFPVSFKLLGDVIEESENYFKNK
jgi:hypothetical protein